MQKEDAGNSPLVSIMMPAYNAGKTVGYALTSLIAQRWRHWECIVVDDGSTDDTAAAVAQINDARIRLIRLPYNQGRGVARQRALNEARGEFVGMLDADDWVYPDKLEKQVAAFHAYPEAVLVGIGMAIIDRDNNIRGVRSVGSGTVARFSTPGKVPVAHAAALLRRSCIGKIRYNPKFKLAQDVDFLRRFLIGRSYVALQDVGYVYSEMASVSLGKITRGYYFSVLGYLQFASRYPLVTLRMVLDQCFKGAFFLVVSAFGGFPHLIRCRSRIPTDEDIAQYESARSAVDSVHRLVTGVESARAG